MKILIGDYVLFEDGRGWTLSGTTGELARLIQEKTFVGAEEISTQYRGAKRTDLTFTVSRIHEDEAAMLEELLFHEHGIPESGVIRFVGRDPLGAERVLYLDGHVQGVSFNHVGKRTFHTYRIVGGALRKDPPAGT